MFEAHGVMVHRKSGERLGHHVYEYRCVCIIRIRKCDAKFKFRFGDEHPNTCIYTLTGNFIKYAETMSQVLNS